MSEARENKKSPVRMATVLSQRAFAERHRVAGRLVHHVIVVERREVSQLHDNRRRNNTRRFRFS